MTTHITKTWFDGEKVVTQEIPESEVYKHEPRCAVIVEVFGKDWRLDYMSLPVGKHRLYTQEYVYTIPPAAQRQWVELTDEEIDKTYETQVWEARRSYARAIEAKLKEKNT
jgi:hypothetical protein